MAGQEGEPVQKAIIPEIRLGKEKILAGKVALVTGSSRGIGQSIARTLAANGASVIVSSTERSKHEGMLTAVKIQENFKLDVIWEPCDVSKPKDCKSLIKKIIDRFGQLDIVVSNAGIRDDALSARMTPEQWERVIAVNLSGAFYIVKEAAWQMRTTGGSIIFISSVASHGNPGQANYAASKAGLEGVAKTLALEYARRNIRVNVVAPGLVDTDLTASLTSEQRGAILEQTPLGRAITRQEVANTVLFLASDVSSGMTAQVLNVDGGMVR